MRNLKLTKIIAIVEPARQTDVAGLRQCAESELASPQKRFSHSASERTVFGAFLAACLLTRSESLAEVAVCEAIESWYPNDDTGALQRLTTEAGLRIRTRRSERPNKAPAWMPRELRAVFDLSQSLRDCLVMRILLGFPRETCSRLTQHDGPTIDRDTTLALRALSAEACRYTACAVIRGATHNTGDPPNDEEFCS